MCSKIQVVKCGYKGSLKTYASSDKLRINVVPMYAVEDISPSTYIPGRTWMFCSLFRKLLRDLLSMEKQITCSAIKPLVKVINDKIVIPQDDDSGLILEIKVCSRLTLKVIMKTVK